MTSKTGLWPTSRLGRVSNALNRKGLWGVRRVGTSQRGLRTSKNHRFRPPKRLCTGAQRTKIEPPGQTRTRSAAWSEHKISTRKGTRTVPDTPPEWLAHAHRSAPQWGQERALGQGWWWSGRRPGGLHALLWTPQPQARESRLWVHLPLLPDACTLRAASTRGGGPARRGWCATRSTWPARSLADRSSGSGKGAPHGARAPVGTESPLL